MCEGRYHSHTRRRKVMKKTLALLIAVLMIVAMLPLSILTVAAEAPTATSTASTNAIQIKDITLFIHSPPKKYTVNPPQCANSTVYIIPYPLPCFQMYFMVAVERRGRSIIFLLNELKSTDVSFDYLPLECSCLFD